MFSVIIPTFNRAELLSQAIRSVLAQGFGDYELIVVDDGSTDSTGEVVASFEAQRIRYLRREDTGSAAAARNTGILRARGKYISFLDDDDEYLPEFLEETYRCFESVAEQVGFTWCGVRPEMPTRPGRYPTLSRCCSR